MKDEIIIKAVYVQDEDKQEILSGRRKTSEKYIKLKFKDIQKQIDESIAPLVETINKSEVNKKDCANLSKVTVKIGFSLKGELVIVSGQVDGAIELEFTNF